MGLCNKTATVDNFGGRYTQRSKVCIGFSDHPVVKPRENALNFTTTFEFSDLDLCDGGWSWKTMQTVLNIEPLILFRRKQSALLENFCVSHIISQYFKGTGEYKTIWMQYEMKMDGTNFPSMNLWPQCQCALKIKGHVLVKSHEKL